MVSGNASEHLLVFTLQDHKYALRLSAVESVLRSVKVVPLPEAPSIVLGIFSYRGRIVPVLDIRRRFRLEGAAIAPEGSFILARASRWTVALSVDSVVGILEDAGAAVPPDRILPRLDYVEGVRQAGSDLILIHDLETFLSLEEEAALGRAMEGHA